MSGRVLTSSAIVDIATDRSVYGRAFLVAAVELGMTFPTPSTALLQAWAAVPAEARALLELFLDAPASSSRISVCQRPAGLACAPTRRIRLDTSMWPPPTRWTWRSSAGLPS